MAVAVIQECDPGRQGTRLADRRRGIARGKDENYVWGVHRHRIATGGAEVEHRSLVHHQREGLRSVRGAVVGSDGDWVGIARARGRRA